MINTEKLREFLADATPGPWMNGNGDIYAEGNKASGYDDRVICGIGVGMFRSHEYAPIKSHKPEGKANAALIVAAVNTLPALLDEVDRLRAENDRLRAALGVYAGPVESSSRNADSYPCWADGYPGGVFVGDNTLDFGDASRAALNKGKNDE